MLELYREYEENPKYHKKWKKEYLEIVNDVNIVRNLLENQENSTLKNIDYSSYEFSRKYNFESFMERLLLERENGISGVGESDLNEDNFRLLINNIDFLKFVQDSILKPNENIYNNIKEVWRKTVGKTNHLRINRIFSASNPELFSCVASENSLKQLEKILEKYGYHKEKGKTWYHRSIAVTKFMREKLEETEINNLEEVINLNVFLWYIKESKEDNFSWKKLNDNTVLKNIDKSIFSRESGIPLGIRPFFNIEDLEQSGKINIEMTFEGNTYIGTLVNRNERTKINWHKDFGNVIDEKFKNWKSILEEKSSENKVVPQIFFEKIGHNRYKIILQSTVEESVVIDDIEDEEKTDTEIFTEGGRKLVFSKVYERKSKNRAEAIKIHGTQCKGCGFDFEEKYGQLGKDFIEVHHVTPLSHIGEEKEINPETDLIPLCSNCHRMIHRLIRASKGEFTNIEDLKKIINQEVL